MKTKLNKLACASLLSIGALGFMPQANAAGTPVGTSITNTANLAFAIAGVAQTPATSNTVSFLVDRKINMILVEDNGGVPSTVVPGSSGSSPGNVFKFKLTNLGNGTQDFGLDLVQMDSGFNLNGNIDNFNTAICQRRGAPVGGNGASINTYVDEVAPDETREVYVICGIPISVANNSFAAFALTAVARTGGNLGTTTTGTYAETAGADTAGVDIVFADTAGVTDAVRDGKYSAYGSFIVKSAELSVVKTNAPLCDPYNFTTNPKNIPGAFVRYSITVANAATAGDTAILGTLTDTIDATNLTFDDNLIAPTASSCAPTTAAESAAGRAFKLSCTGGTRACATAPIYRTAVAGDDGFDYTSGTVTAGFVDALTAEAGYNAGELKAGESITLEFNAEVK